MAVPVPLLTLRLLSTTAQESNKKFGVLHQEKQCFEAMLLLTTK
jgi:hypothetical protein